MHQIQKKYHRKAALTVRMQDNYHTAASQPENNTCDSLPSCYRHHTEEILPSSEDCHDPCEKQFLNSGISSACDLEMLEKKRQWCQSKKSSQNKGERTMRDEIKQEIGFKRYLKRAYLQENSQCSTFSYIEGPKENKSTQSKNSKQMCLNIRNMAFGHQDLNSFGKQSSPDASFRQKLDAGKIKRKELSRGNELFLPKIRRGSGGKLERGKIEGRSGEKMMMI